MATKPNKGDRLPNPSSKRSKRREKVAACLKGVKLDGCLPKVKTHWEEVEAVARRLGMSSAALPDGRIPRGLKLYGSPKAVQDVQAKQATNQHPLERTPGEALEGPDLGEAASVFNTMTEASGTSDSFQFTACLQAYQGQPQAFCEAKEEQLKREAEECEERSRNEVMAIKHNAEELVEQQVALTQNLEKRLLEKDKLLESRAQEYECIVCRNARADTVLFPCKHQHLCTPCLQEHFRQQSGQESAQESLREVSCPSCRTPVSFWTTVYRP
eukprot:Skav224984  [mRNA]  locus=scaffold560:231468:232280:- [translate_table: standard]